MSLAHREEWDKTWAFITRILQEYKGGGGRLVSRPQIIGKGPRLFDSHRSYFPNDGAIPTSSSQHIGFVKIMTRQRGMEIFCLRLGTISSRN